MDNEVRERLGHLTRRLADAAFARACDSGVAEGEFRAAVKTLAEHLNEVRRRSTVVHLEREMA